MNRSTATFALVTALGVCSFASVARAQTAPAAGTPAATPETAPAPTPSATMRTEGGRHVYVATDTIEIRGELQRPFAFTLSGRSSLGYSYFEQPVRFVDEILNAIRRGAPF